LAIPTAAVYADVSVFTVDGKNLLCDAKNVAINPGLVEASSKGFCSLDDYIVPVGISNEFTFSADLSDSVRNLISVDVTAFTVFSNAYIGWLDSLSFSVSNGYNAIGAYANFVRQQGRNERTLSCSATIHVDYSNAGVGEAFWDYILNLMKMDTRAELTPSSYRDLFTTTLVGTLEESSNARKLDIGGTWKINPSYSISSGDFQSGSIALQYQSGTAFTVTGTLQSSLGLLKTAYDDSEIAVVVTPHTNFTAFNATGRLRDLTIDTSGDSISGVNGTVVITSSVT